MYKLAIKKPVTTTMLLLVIVLGGVVSLLGLNIDLMPSMNIPIAIVSTGYSGAGPREVETLISKPLEASLATVSNIKTISTTSNDGNSVIVLEFIDGTDIDMASLDVREKIDMVKSYLPKEASEPLVMKIDPNSMSGIYVGVTGNIDLVELESVLEDKIDKRLERLDGVASVSFMGGLEEIIDVQLMPEKLSGYGVTESQIIATLSSENLNLPSGTLVSGTQKLQVRAVGQYKSIDDIKMLPIITPTGAILQLSDLATVTRSTAEPTSGAVINGERSIIMTIQKQSTANTVKVSEKVNKELAAIAADYPNLKFSTISDGADYIMKSVNNVLETLFWACILSVFVIFMFLRNVRSSMIIGISIASSVIATFAVMYLTDMTLNIISLGGLTIGIGMFVDNSIVVMESIFQHREKGESSLESAFEGTKEVAIAVLASTATNCAVFVPMIFVTGTVGQIFKDLSLTICFSLLVSLIVAFTFVPMACASMMKYDELGKKHRRIPFLTAALDKWGGFVDNFEEKYTRLLVWSLAHKKRIFAIVIIAFIGTMSVTPFLGASFLPKMDQGEVITTVELPTGMRVEDAIVICDEIIAKISDIPEIDYAFAYTGSGEMSLMMGSGVDQATIYTLLYDVQERTRSADEVAEEMRVRLKDYAGAKITVSTSQSSMGQYSSADISFRLNGMETEALKEISADVVEKVSQIEGIREVTSSAGKSIPEANIVVNRAKAAQYGLTAASVANAVNIAVSGKTAAAYKISGTEIDIKVRHNRSGIEYLNDVRNIRLSTPAGGGVLLTEIADVTLNDGPASINRINQQETITIEANIAGRKLDAIQKDLTKLLEAYPMPEGYSYQFTGDLESMMASFISLLIVLLVSVVLVYMIMAAQFESLLNPFIIMFSVPLAITGGLFSLFVTRTELNVSGFMGLILLVGMVVNNAIVLIDYTDQVRRQGHDTVEAIMIAAPSRLRPILMTALTAILGLMPMGLATGSGTELTKDLSLVSIGGLFLSTFVTLIFIPVLYAIFDSGKQKRLDKKAARRALKSVPSVDEGIGI